MTSHAQGGYITGVQGNLDPIQIDALQVIHLEPGDVLAVKFDRTLTAQQADSVRDQVKRLLPDNEVMVLDKGIELATVRPDTATPVHRWHYGPTEADPDPAKMWHEACDGEVLLLEGGAICRRCDHQWESPE